MKRVPLFIIALIALACTRPSGNQQELVNRIDSLEKRMSSSYKPGLGEFMSSIQTHHAKLWFAGQNHNWELADFEVHEIMEAVENIQKFETERQESKLTSILYPPIDSLNKAIKLEDVALFDRSYKQLTNTCNTCHQQVHFAFNVVKTPEISTFSNQDFSSLKGQ